MASRTLDPLVVRSGHVTVERRLDVEPRGIVVSVGLTSTGAEPLCVRVVDYLPGNWPVDEIGFHDRHAPRSGTATADRVSFDAVVRPETETVVVYGATLPEAVDPDRLREDQAFSPPHVDGVEAVPPGEPVDNDASVPDAERDGGCSPATPPPGSSVVDRLVAALEADDLADEQLDALRGALVADDRVRPADLAALSDELAATGDRLDALEAALADTDAGVDALEADVAALRATLDSHADRLDAIEALRGRLLGALDPEDA